MAVAGLSVSWFIVAVGVVLGVASGVVFGVTFNVAAGAAAGVAIGVIGGVGSGVAGGVAAGVVSGVASGVVGGVSSGTASGLVSGVASGTASVRVNMALNMALGAAAGAAVGVVGGVADGVADGMAVGVVYGVAWGVASTLVIFRVPFYFSEALWTFGSSAIVRAFPAVSRRFAPALPFLHHDLIHFPLPGLHSFLVRLADQDAVLAQSLIGEASTTIAQQTPARRALAELQSKSLDRAARDCTWARAAVLDLPFLPRPDYVSDTSPIGRFRSAAQDLHAAHLTTDHLRRRNALERARSTLTSFRFALIGKRRRDDLERFLAPTSQVWLDVIAEELRTLTDDERAHPQIPNPFEPGPPLRPDDADLFKGRADLVRLIDHDLADHRRAPLLLTGQRRMGKTSLLGMLPERLGTGTQVVPLNFQALSGSPHREHPHRWLAEAIAKARPDVPPPPADAAWGETLAWLKDADANLGTTRVLVAIDEIERVQTGIEEGWTTPAFLDFLRAAGDSLRNVRLLLVSAHPLHRLGRSWTDRLISVVHREIGYLLPDEAADLARSPMAGFPDIYPAGGVERIVRETNGHPYLIQLVCDGLIRDLNGKGLLGAADADLTRALDRVLGDTPLFRELWSSSTRTDEERALLRRLVVDGDSACDSRSCAARSRARGLCRTLRQRLSDRRSAVCEMDPRARLTPCARRPGRTGWL
jgi:hypothetical protein